MWSHVKFTGDGAVANVSVSFFKVVDEGGDPQRLKVGELYQVFWSPVDEDTPQKLIAAGNEILDIPNDMNNSRRKGRLRDGPLKGYYEAMLLDVKLSEDSFDASIERTSTSASSRVRIPTKKVVESKEVEASLKSRKKSAREEKKTEKLAAAEASKANLLSLMNMCKPPEPVPVGSGKGKPQKESSSSDSECDSPERNANATSSSEHKGDSDEDSWKKKFLALQAELANKKSSSKKQKKHKREKKLKELSKESSKEFKAGDLKKDAGNLKDKTANKEADRTKQPTGSTSDFVPVVEKEGCGLDGGKSSTTNDADKQSRKTEGGIGKADLGEDDPVDSDDEFVVLKKRRIKRDEACDSPFVFNRAAALWKPEVLAIRSPTGVPSSSRGGGGEGTPVGYPKLTPSKVATVKESLEERIREEEPGIAKKNLERRLNRVNYHLGQKISTVRRSFRAKGQEVPKATEVWDDIEKKKQA